MTGESEQIVELLNAWGEQGDAFEVADVSQDSGGVHARLRDRTDAAELDLRADSANIRVTISWHFPVNDREGLSSLIEAIDDSRAGNVSCAVADESKQRSVEVQAVIYVDGLSRHALNTGVGEIAKARRQLEAGLAGLAAAETAGAEARRYLEAQVILVDQQAQEVQASIEAAEVARAEDLRRREEEEKRLEETTREMRAEIENELRADIAALQVETLEVVPEPPAPDTTNLATTTACAHCGASLAEEARFCISCGTPVEAVVQSCGNCGAVLADGAQFCISCGTRAS